MSIIKKKWSSKDYLKQYYDLKNLPLDEVLLVKYVINFLKKFSINQFKELIDFGAGPTVHRLIPFSPYVENIYIADYIPKNLKEVSAWIKNKKTAHDWSGQIDHILKIENKENSYKKMEMRKRLFKKKIKGLIHCDIFKKKPLKINRKFDILVSFYCADSITSSKKIWKDSLRNMLGLIKPRGWVIMSALRNTKKYKVENNFFPSPNINEKDIHRALVNNSFDPKTIHVKIIPALNWKEEGIKSLMVVQARKNAKTY